MDPDGNMEWFGQLSGRGIKPGLDNTEELLRRVGNPQEGMRFIHVAGTDGKGSVCAMIESILHASGFRVGAFVSPHIMKVNECIRMDGEEMPDRELIEMIGAVRPHVEAMAREGMECSSFEVLTVLAILYFKTVSADISVIEVGMGGRLDSTNVIIPEVTVINNIGLEHTEFLGDSIEEVAFEKAGIMKPGVPCVTMNQDTVFEVLSRHAEEVGCPLHRVMSTDAEVMASWPDSIDMVYRGELYNVSLPGRHQARNASLAIEAVSLLKDFSEREPAVREGLGAVSWPCRMQKLFAEPVIVDVTHTVNGARCLQGDIGEIYGRVVLVLGMLSDKDIDGVSRELAPIAEKVFIAAPDSPRASPSERTAEIFSKYREVTAVYHTVAEAVEAALEQRGDLNVLVTGSFRTAEDVLTWLQSRYATS